MFVAGATTGNANQRRVLIRQNAIEGQAYGTIGQVDDTGKGVLPRLAAVGAAPAEEQPQRADQLDAVEVHVRPGDDGDYRAD